MLDGRAVHLVSEIGGRCLHERDIRGHLNDLLGLGQFKLPVKGNRLTRFHHDSRNPDRGKIACLDLDCIVSRRHQREAVGTIASGCRALRDVRADVGDRHRGVWHHGPRGIGNRARDDTLHGL